MNNTGRHHMTADDAQAILRALHTAHVDVTVGGGWGIDALLRGQAVSQWRGSLYVAVGCGCLVWMGRGDVG